MKIIRIEKNKRSNLDRRKKVNWILTSKFIDGVEYRKAHEFPANMTIDECIEEVKKS